MRIRLVKKDDKHSKSRLEALIARKKPRCCPSSVALTAAAAKSSVTGAVGVVVILSGPQCPKRAKSTDLLAGRLSSPMHE